jgi:MFS-type transporter involved in bile tolerance (Atg22 family)
VPAQLIAFALALIAGFVLGQDPPIARYFAVLAVLIGFSAVPPLLIARIPAVPHETDPPQRSSLRETFLRPLRDPRYRRFLVSWAVIVAAINMARPFTVPFLNAELGFPSSLTVHASALHVIGVAAGLLAWGRLSDSRGGRIVIARATLLAGAALALLGGVPLFATSAYAAAALAAGALFTLGLAIGGQNLARTVYALAVAPTEARSQYIGVFFVVNGIVSALSSALTGLYLDLIPNMVELFGLELLYVRLHFLVMAAALCGISLWQRRADY